VVLGALLGAGGLYLAQTLTAADAKPCAARCGEGTVCEGDRCVVAPLEDEVEAEVEADDGKSKRKRKRRRKSGVGASEDGPVANQGPAFDDDSKVPRFDMNKDQSIGMSDGSGRLSDGQIDAALRKLDPAFQKCARDAAERVDELGSGTVKLELGVAGSGKVTGVNVRAPANLADAGIVACVRKAVYAHKFPIFDGPEMRVSSSFKVD
jgi:hypothetical protein